MTASPIKKRPRNADRPRAKALNPAAEVLEVFLADRPPRTAEAYRGDVAKLAIFLGRSQLADAVAELLEAGPGGAFAIASRYKGHLRGQLAANTINRRLATLRSLVDTAYQMNVVPWALRIPALHVEPVRNTRGPGRETVRRMLVIAAARPSPKRQRDVAILRLLYDLALRRMEVCELRIRHFDAKTPALSVLGKGRAQRRWLSLPLQTQEALSEWLATYSPQTDDPPLVCSLDHAGPGGPLTGPGLYYIIRQLGRLAGAHVTPHGIRHTAITDAANLAGLSILEVQRFSRHKKVETVQTYYDEARDIAGEIARQLADGLGNRCGPAC